MICRLLRAPAWCV